MGLQTTLTADEVAALLRVPRGRVYEMTRDESRFFGRPGIVLRIGRQLRFNRTAFEQWLDRGGSVQRSHDETGPIA